MMRKWRIWLPISAIVIICLAFGMIILRKPTNSLPKQSTEAASGFMQVYYYEKNIPGDFKLVGASTSFTNGILSFQLRNTKDQKVTVTEQSMPKDLSSSEVFGGETVDGASGSATVTFKEGRIIGVLLTKDRQTMVTLNSSDSVETSEIKDLVRSLRPL